MHRGDTTMVTTALWVIPVVEKDTFTSPSYTTWLSVFAFILNSWAINIDSCNIINDALGWKTVIVSSLYEYLWMFYFKRTTSRVVVIPLMFTCPTHMNVHLSIFLFSERFKIAIFNYFHMAFVFGTFSHDIII